jgi:hypothetical protein
MDEDTFSGKLMNAHARLARPEWELQRYKERDGWQPGAALDRLKDEIVICEALLAHTENQRDVNFGGI